MVLLPDVPTMAESGYPTALATFWTGLLAPASMPPALVERLNHEVNQGLETDLKTTLVAMAAAPRPGSPQDFAALIAAEAAAWAAVVKTAGTTVE